MVRTQLFRVVCCLLPAVFALSATAQNPTRGADIPDAPPQPPLTAAQKEPLNPKLPTIFVVGDSTARNKADLGWGDHFAHYFDLSRVNVANRARAGRSSRTFIQEGSWAAVLNEMKPGDYLLLQMGHNDGGALSGPKSRGTLKGIGNETKDVLQQDGKMLTIHTYGWYIRRYIADARARGVTPILLSLTVRNIWKNGHIERDMGYDGYIRQLAKEEHVEFVDMANVAADGFEKLGPEKTAALFPVDHTHTSAEGAERNAHSVVVALRKAHSPIVKYLLPSSR